MFSFLKKKNQNERFCASLLTFLLEEIEYSFKKRDFDSFDLFKENFEKILYVFFLVEKFCMNQAGLTPKIQSLLSDILSALKSKVDKELKSDERQKVYKKLIEYDDFSLNNDSINGERLKTLKWLVDEELKLKELKSKEILSLSQQKSIGCNLNFYLTQRQIITFQRTLECVNLGAIGEAYHQLCIFIINEGFNKLEKFSVFEILCIKIMANAIISYVEKNRGKSSNNQHFSSN